MKKKKTGFLHSFLELPHGIPSHDTFYRTFCTLNPDKFQECSSHWVQSAFPDALTIPDDETRVVPVDGITVRGSRGKGKKAVLIVSARSSKLSLVTGQTKVD